MPNRGIYGSLSSIPVEMGDCGTAFVDVSPEFPNLCFQIPLIATGGAKPLSLSLLYNERAAAPSSGVGTLVSYLREFLGCLLHHITFCQ